jgi:hypothetical protein
LQPQNNAAQKPQKANTTIPPSQKPKIIETTIPSYKRKYNIFMQLYSGNSSFISGLLVTKQNDPVC